jgi:putative transposase
MEGKTEATSEEKFKLIQEMTQRDNNELNISWLCEMACVSRSGYYN